MSAVTGIDSVLFAAADLSTGGEGALIDAGNDTEETVGSGGGAAADECVLESAAEADDDKPVGALIAGSVLASK